MNILVIDCRSRKLSKVTDQITACHVQPVIWPMDQLPVHPSLFYEGVVITGGPLMWSEVKDQYLSRFEFLKTVKVPVLGICFGHQMLGLLHQAKIFRGTYISKPHAVTILEQGLLFEGFGSSARFSQSHHEGITLPPRFMHLARSKEYEVEAMKHPNKPIYGVQFHPERSGENGQLLFQNFIRLCTRKDN